MIKEKDIQDAIGLLQLNIQILKYNDANYFNASIIQDALYSNRLEFLMANMGGKACVSSFTVLDYIIDKCSITGRPF